ncbi:MAG: TldD/PmbA family protein [candidate division WS1 bacterium]|nr:TldD/PmbA family protein [candidate division WS1 bacterium]
MADLMQLAEAAVEAALHSGAEWADAVCANSRVIAVEVENSSLRECETSRELGLGVRAFFHGGRGLASLLHPTPAGATECGRQAAEMARATTDDPHFVALPDPQPAPEVPDLFDPQVPGLSAEQAVRWCREGLEEARAVTEEAIVSGGVALMWGEQALASSTGMRVTTQSSYLSIGFDAIVRRGDDVGIYWEWDAARRLEDFQPHGVARTAAETALSYLGARPLRTATMPVILGPEAADALFTRLISAANAESIQRHRSFLVDKEGQPVASELLTLREEPLIPAGLSSAATDGEGLPKQPRTLVDRGVLTTYLHNSYTAGKASAPNTAHARRSGYSGEVGIGFANLLPQTGEKTAQELIREVDEGLYICASSLSTDSITGDVSATVDLGRKIERGELTHPVQATMIGGNLLDFMTRLEALSSDYRAEPGRVMPTARLRQVQVSSGG